MLKNRIKQITRKYFPYPEYNQGQEETIIETVHHLLKGVEHVIIEAPTGVGKSAIVYTVDQVLRELKGTTRHRTSVVTATKGLQDQYVAEFDNIFDLKGKANYSCPYSCGPYNSPACRQKLSSKTCNPKGFCPYIKTRQQWCIVEDFRVTNTAFQIKAPPNLIASAESIPDVVVIDECHGLPKQLIDHNTLDIDVENLGSTIKSLGKVFESKLIDAVNEFLHMKVGTAFFPTGDIKEKFKILCDEIIKTIVALETTNDPKDGQIKDELMELEESLNLFVKGGEWIIIDFIYCKKLVIKPVYAHQVAQHGLFRKCGQFVHMSATICGFEEYKKELGIANKKCATIQIESPIPKENRKIKYVGGIKVNRDVDYGDLVSTIDCVIDQREVAENGVIHTVSFELAEKIKERSKFSKRMVIMKDRDLIIETLNKPTGVILLSPSIEVGYDFKGDMCRWQIIPKVPYGFLGDPLINLNMRRSSKWYSREAIIRIVQASGRAVRGITDFADTYIIDSNFERLYGSNKELFPKWWASAIYRERL